MLAGSHPHQSTPPTNSHAPSPVVVLAQTLHHIRQAQRLGGLLEDREEGPLAGAGGLHVHACTDGAEMALWLAATL